MKPRILDRLSRFLGDARGSMLAYTAFVVPILLGFAGMSIDMGYWYASTRLTQSAADSAAIAGALEVMRSDSDQAAIELAVQKDAANHGFTAANGDTITPRWPPLTGTNAGAMDSVEVVVTRPGAGFFARALFDANPDISARAVAVAGSTNTCIWSLSPDAASAVSVSGTANVSLGCGVLVNSNDGSALTQGGSSCLTATEVKVVGGASGSCVNPTPLTGINPVVDPLEAFDFETLYIENYGAMPACSNGNNAVHNGNGTFSPGCYTKDFKINTNGTVTFEPGVYILDSAALDISAQSTVLGDGVVFYFTNTGGGGTEGVTINGGANVQLSAPDTGPFAGTLFVQDRDSPTLTTYKLNGGSAQDLEGIIYLPNQTLQFSGGATLNSSTSLIIADTVSFTGNTDIGDFEGTPILANPLLISATLVE